MKTEINPFLIQQYQGPAYFCDRISETNTLLENIQNHSNTAFFAQRRIGKTALIQHVFHQLAKKKTMTIYLDIYATQNLKEFTNQLANSIYNLYPVNKSLGKRFLEAIKLLRPIISLDEITGNAELSLDITQPKQFEKTIPQLLQFLDQQPTRTVIAIDEFQQILEYPEQNVEAILRTAIAPLKQTSFIFCGSNQAMMQTIFNAAKRPFYASTKNINLLKIDSGLYTQFIRKKIKEHQRTISDTAVDQILTLTQSHTYYTQCLCNTIFASHIKNIELEHVYQALNKILSQNEGTYYQYRQLLTAAQWQLLRAIALEGTVDKPYAQQFIYRHQLGTPANVKRSLEALIQKEMVYQNTNLKNPYFEVYDKFLMLWMQHK
jgi:tetratricopeptide (TPR) repeat protein